MATKEQNKRHYWKHRERLLANQKAYYQKNIDKRRAYARNYTAKNPDKRLHCRLRSEFGITLQQFQDMIVAQQNRCAICWHEMSPACVDHDHETGEIRGLLCYSCNAGIGMLKDDPQLFRAAITYVS